MVNRTQFFRKNCVVLLRNKRMTQFFSWQSPTPMPTHARDDGRLGRLRRGRPFVSRDWSRYVQVVVSARRRRGWSRPRACSCGEEKTVSFFCETKERHSFLSGSFRRRRRANPNPPNHDIRLIASDQARIRAETDALGAPTDHSTHRSPPHVVADGWHGATLQEPENRRNCGHFEGICPRKNPLCIII